MDTPYAFVARIEAKPEKAEDVAALLTGALPLAQAEPGTVYGMPRATSPTTFWIFDTFGSEDARQAHINGEIAAALMAKADELLAVHQDSPRRRACGEIAAGPSEHLARKETLQRRAHVWAKALPA